MTFFCYIHLSLPSTLGLFIKSVFYLFWVQCVLLGPAYSVTLLCFTLYTIMEQSRNLMKNLISKAAGYVAPVAKRTVLINGCTQSVALHIARSLSAAGFRVVACDLPQNWLNPTRFSMAVDEYYTVPRPEQSVQEYVRALCEIARREKVDLFFPISTSEGVVFDALAKAQLELQGCTCFIPTAENVRRLNNKLSFFELAAKCGFKVPLHYKVSSITEIQQLFESGIVSKKRPFVLTSVRCYNKYIQDSVVMPATIEEFMANIGEDDNYNYRCSLLLQECIPGRSLTTSTTILENNIIAHSACYNEPRFEYDHVQNMNSLEWIQTFMKMYPSQLTGNFIFNFIVGKEDGKLYPESCVTGVGQAALVFQPECALGQAMLTDIPYQVPFLPKWPHQVYWIYEEIWQIIRNFPNSTALLASIWTMCFGREAVFSFWDPLPFVALNHLHLPFLVIISLLQRKGWSSIDFRSGKLIS